MQERVYFNPDHAKLVSKSNSMAKGFSTQDSGQGCTLLGHSSESIIHVLSQPIHRDAITRSSECYVCERWVINQLNKWVALVLLIARNL